MTPVNYLRLNGSTAEIDLDAVVDIVDGWSNIRSGWQGFIVFSPTENCFIELQSTVPDVRGNSDSRSVEVDEHYIKTTYSLTSAQITKLRDAPFQWKFIKNR